MPFFVILIVVSFVFYLFYKFKYFRSSYPIEKQWISSKASISLGSFILFFGINQLIMWNTTVTLIVGIIFLLIGGLNVWFGYKAFRHYLPFVVEEAKKRNSA